MKTYKQRTDSILKKVQKIKQKRRKTVMISVVSSLCGVFILCNAILFLPQLFLVKKDAGGNVAAPEMIESSNVTSTDENYPNLQYEYLITQIKKVTKNNETQSPEEESSEEFWEPGLDHEESVSGNTYQKLTSNSIEGVANGNLFQSTQTHIFYVKESAKITDNHTLFVYSIEGKNSQKIAQFSIKKAENFGERSYFKGSPLLFLSEDKRTLTVVAPYMVVRQAEYRPYTAIISLDVSNPASIKENTRAYLSGSLQTAKEVGGSLVMSTKFQIRNAVDYFNELTFVPHYGKANAMQGVQEDDIIYPEKEPENTNYTTLCKVDAKNLNLQGFTAFFSMDAAAVITKNYAFFHQSTTGYWDDETDKETLTDIHSIGYKNGFSYQGACTILGIVNEGSMEEKDGVLQVTASDLKTNKQIRYDVDLSNQELLSQVETEKSYDYLTVFYGDTLLGLQVGEADDFYIKTYRKTEGGLDVVASYKMQGIFAKEENAYFVDKERGLFGLCARVETENGWQDSYVLLQFNGSEWKKVQVKTPCDGVETTRAIWMDGYFYICSGETFYAVSV